MRRLALAALAAASVVCSRASAGEVDETKPRARVSELAEQKIAAWQSPGFRLQLGFDYELIWPGRNAPAMHGYAPTLRLGWRFDERWSLMALLRYSVVAGDFEGLRWSAVAEPVFHVWRGLAVSLGAGYGGLLGSRSRYYDVYRTTGDAGVPVQPAGSAVLDECDGDGFLILGRVEYLFTVGDLFATGPTVRFDGQWTRCKARDYEEALDEEVVRTAWWLHGTLGLGWLVAWR